MNTAFFYINAEFWCWALRHQFNIMIGHRKSYSSRDFLEIPKHGNYPSFLTGKEVQVEKWNSLLSVPKWDREWKKADLCYLWLYRRGYHPLTQINMKHFSGVSASWSRGWSLTVAKRPCTGVCGRVGVCVGHFVVSIGYTCGSLLPMCSGAAFACCTPLGVS